MKILTLFFLFISILAPNQLHSGITKWFNSENYLETIKKYSLTRNLSSNQNYPNYKNDRNDISGPFEILIEFREKSHPWGSEVTSECKLENYIIELIDKSTAYSIEDCDIDYELNITQDHIVAINLVFASQKYHLLKLGNQKYGFKIVNSESYLGDSKDATSDTFLSDKEIIEKEFKKHINIKSKISWDYVSKRIKEKYARSISANSLRQKWKENGDPNVIKMSDIKKRSEGKAADAIMTKIIESQISRNVKQLKFPALRKQFELEFFQNSKTFKNDAKTPPKGFIHFYKKSFDDYCRKMHPDLLASLEIKTFNIKVILDIIKRLNS